MSTPYMVGTDRFSRKQIILALHFRNTYMVAINEHRVGRLEPIIYFESWDVESSHYFLSTRILNTLDKYN